MALMHSALMYGHQLLSAERQRCTVLYSLILQWLWEQINTDRTLFFAHVQALLYFLQGLDLFVLIITIEAHLKRLR